MKIKGKKRIKNLISSCTLNKKRKKLKKEKEAKIKDKDNTNKIENNTGNEEKECYNLKT